MWEKEQVHPVAPNFARLNCYREGSYLAADDGVLE